VRAICGSAVAINEHGHGFGYHAIKMTVSK